MTVRKRKEEKRRAIQCDNLSCFLKLKFPFLASKVWYVNPLKLKFSKQAKNITVVLPCFKISGKSHSSMPRPLAPDPIKVLPCVWFLFRTNRNCIAVTYPSIYLAHYPIWDKSLYRRYNSKWKYLLLLKL